MGHAIRVILVAATLQGSIWSASARPDLSELYSGHDLYRRLAQHQAIENRVPFAIVDAVMSVESAYKTERHWRCGRGRIDAGAAVYRDNARPNIRLR